MGRTRRALKRLRWYVASLMGDNHYARYLDHHRRSHTGEPALTEREYWKARHRAADRNHAGIQP